MSLLVSPGCLVMFDDWPDASTRSTGGTASRGGATATDGGTAGSAPLVSGGAATGGGAGSAATTGGTASGGIANAGTWTGGSASGGATATIVPSRGQIFWLSLNGDRASQGEQPNDLLNVDGRFYVTKDSCASVTFDATTRCATGTLCNYDGAYWGMAVEFDFRAMGSPPTGKLLWNPEEHDAIGVAWGISGTPTAAFQAWVLQMDPRYATSCTAEICEVAGPPWGKARIGLNGEFYFDSLDHDNWSGTGLDFSYDPTRVFALQFKIPAVDVGAASFRFCIERLGLVVPL